MSINKSGSQVYFEGMFTGSSGFPFRQISKAQYEQTSLTKQQADDREYPKVCVNLQTDVR